MYLFTCMNHLQLPFYVIACDVQVIQVQVQRGPGCQKYKFVEIIKLSTSNGFGEHFVTLAETKISLNSIFFFKLLKHLQDFSLTSVLLQFLLQSYLYRYTRPHLINTNSQFGVVNKLFLTTATLRSRL